MKKDITLGTLEHYGTWTDIRTRLCNLFGCSLTPALLSNGDDTWLVTVRAHKRLTKDDIAYLQGYFDALVQRIGR